METKKILEVRTKSRGYAHEVNTINWSDKSEITKQDIENYIDKHCYFGYKILSHGYDFATIKCYTD